MLDHFREHGWVRVEGAFSADDAARMREVTWRALESVGIRRDDPATWTKERPDHLQRLKSDPVFEAVGTAATRAAVDELVERRPWSVRDWGAFFLVFPTPGRPWSLASTGWHLDAPYTDPLWPVAGLKIHAMYGDVLPRSGGMNVIDGSHRLVHEFFAANPVAPPAARQRKALLRSLDLSTVTVLENTAAAGDVILMHPLLLHAPPACHAGTHPRFLLNKDIRV